MNYTIIFPAPPTTWNCKWFPRLPEFACVCVRTFHVETKAQLLRSLREPWAMTRKQFIVKRTADNELKAFYTAENGKLIQHALTPACVKMLNRYIPELTHEP